MRLPLLGSIVSVLFSLSFQAWAEAPPARNHASILMYHHISAETPRSTSTDPETFKQHLKLLDEQGFQIWSLPRVAEHLSSHTPMPDKVAVLTFDDAYISVYETALPILQAQELPFTIFVNAEPVNHGNKLYMSWSQLREAKKRGATIANHSLSHTHMIRRLGEESEQAWLERMRVEISQNQQQLNKHLNTTTDKTAPKLFAYPYGEFNPALEGLLAEMGYLAFGQQSGPASSFSSLQGIPRYAANGIYANPKTLKTKLLALPFPVVSESPSSGVLSPGERSPELTLTLAEGDYRLAQLRCYGPGGESLLVETEDVGSGNRIKVKTQQSLNAGRHRFNCTAPHKHENRWFWFSRQWMLPAPDSSWYKS